MKFINSIAIMAAVAFGFPTVGERASNDVQVAHLTFHGGPASYQLAVPADGTVLKTNNQIAISIIDAPDYNAISQCNFKFKKSSPNKPPPTLVNSINGGGLQQIHVGPPTPILSVSCEGFCVPNFGDCYDHNGQYVGPCCNGLCAADKCRPWPV